jgi:hypothetical protein
VEIERRRGENGQKEEHYVVRHLERVAAGTSYPIMAQRFGEVAKAVRDRTRSRPDLFVDLTGFGQPLIDEVKRHGSYSRMRSVFFNFGDRRAEEGGVIRLGKGWLVCKLQMLLQSHQLHLPRSVDAETLAQELMDYEVEVQPDANDRYGAFRVGSHDELATALGLTIQQPPLGGVEHAWIRL